MAGPSVGASARNEEVKLSRQSHEGMAMHAGGDEEDDGAEHHQRRVP
jgi:hypothetical protein